MFPLCDQRGHVLGFGARALTPERTPKYLNTSDNELFHKGSIVYGADLARAAAARAGRVVLVEGYTDVIALHQAGVPEAVGSMGTALTEPQVDALARLAPRALFCQDPDTAGQEAVRRGIAELRRVNRARAGRGVEFQIVRLPPGEDPADVVARSGADAMRSLLEAAVPVERFEVEQALAAAGERSPDEVLAEIAPVIAALGPSVLRDELVQLVANRLGLRDSVVNAALAGRRRPAAVPGRDEPRVGDARPPGAGRADLPALCAWPCPTRASASWPRPTSTTGSPRRPRAAPPPTCAAACARRPPTCRPATSRSPAWSPSS